MGGLGAAEGCAKKKRQRMIFKAGQQEGDGPTMYVDVLLCVGV